MRRIALLCSLFALPLMPISAQVNNTGGSGWTVSVYTVSSGTTSLFYNAFVPAGGHPGVWEDNTASTQWISAWASSWVTTSASHAKSAARPLPNATVSTAPEPA